MIDLETMGTGAHAPIVAIGAVVFDECDTARLIERSKKALDVVDLFGEKNCLYQIIKPESNVRKADMGTVIWWLRQSEEARAIFSKDQQERHACELTGALGVLSFFIKALGAGVQVWGNGVDFDNVILATAYRDFCIELPWSHWDNRCFRTIKNIVSVKPFKPAWQVAHNAIDDAGAQAIHLCQIIEVLREKGLR